MILGKSEKNAIWLVQILPLKIITLFQAIIVLKNIN